LRNLPYSLQSISFIGSSIFNQPVNDLPSSLTSLRFEVEENAPSNTRKKRGYCSKFSQEFELGPGLKELQVGASCPIANCKLPDSLTILEVPAGSNLPVIPHGCAVYYC
jgi:hypothetical protein